MELVYLWVEDYKNIKRQGFNFSPRFECKYDGEILTICDKTKKECKDNNYIENFFGDNINVTAIVGKNGSGKSSIITMLENIDSYPCELYLQYRKLFIILFYSDKFKFTGYTNIEVVHNAYNFMNSSIPLQENPEDSIDIRNASYKNGKKKLLGRLSYKADCTFDKYSFLTLYSEMPYPYEEHREIKILRNKTIDYSESNIANIAIQNAKENFTFPLATFLLLPKTIFLSKDKKLIAKYIDDITRIKPYEKQSKCQEEIDRLLIEDTRKGETTYNISYSLMAYMINKIIKKGDCIEFLNEYKINKGENTIQNFFDRIKTSKNYNLFEYKKLIKKIYYDIQDISENELKKIKKYKEFIRFDFEDIKGRKFSNLSHGEKSIYAQLVSIYNVVKESEKNLVALDEPDLSLHPMWQKKYINELISLLQNINTKCHIIFTTHSPFLLSDIPKQNIIFLDTDEKSNCKVVDGLKEKKQTFGANIHTLLSDSFFMEDGLMGEFAKNKIMQIQKFHKKVIKYRENEKVKKAYICFYDKKQKEFEQIQSIIGEPFLKTIVKNQLEEIETILFKDKAKQLAIQRFINEFGEDAINEVIKNGKS